MKKEQLENILGEPVIRVRTLSGGDIAHTERVDTKTKSYLVKSGSFPDAKALFEKEAEGLAAIKKSKTIGIPNIIGNHSFEGTSCLILAFVKTKQAGPRDMERLGRELARLHLATKTDFFGFETDNFIGKLPQSNQKHSDWSAFYVKERLLPQLNYALNLRLLGPLEIPKAERLNERCQELFGTVSPSLLHGDLWSGNYLIGTNGDPYLIDPAVYYGHSEVDLAMSKLFGGFSTPFYEAYHEIIPRHENHVALVEIYQLYYLLVHLNLFGNSYRNAVVHLLKKYF